MGLFSRSQNADDPCFGRQGALTLQWHVTERCNLACAHCYQAGPPPSELDFAGQLHILDQFKELLRLHPACGSGAPLRGHLTLTGGEPLIHPDFFRLLEAVAARRAWTGFSILTNGTLIDAAVARRLAPLNPAYVQVSVEGGPATHDRIRGEGSHARAVRAVRVLVAAGIPVMLSFTAHRGNWREFPQVVALGRRLGAARVWADRLVPLGAGAELDSLSPDETRRFFALMRRCRNSPRRFLAPRTEVAMHRALQFLAGGGRPYRCAAGNTLLTLMPGGDLYPCRRMPIRIGNVLECPLDRLYLEDETLRALRDRNRIPATCASCLYVHLCGGGLRCLAHAVHGSPFAVDPGCWLAGGSGAPADWGPQIATSLAKSMTESTRNAPKEVSVSHDRSRT